MRQIRTETIRNRISSRERVIETEEKNWEKFLTSRQTATAEMDGLGESKKWRSKIDD